MNDLECLKINYDVDGWKTISEREGNHCIVPLGAVYAIRSLIEEIERLRAENNELGAEMQCSNIERYRSGDEYTFSEYTIQQFAAAILLDAARICDDIDKNGDPTAFECGFTMKELAKELTQ